MADSSKPIENLVGFITAEAREKATEIEQEAQETYTIEKQRMIEAEKKKIKAEFERKEKQVAIEKRIKTSNLQKDQRLRILKERDALLKEMQAKAGQKLVALTRSPQYPEILANLITQAVVDLDPSDKPHLKVAVVARDTGILAQVLPKAAAAVKQACGASVNLTPAETVLPDDEIGGAIVLADSGKIKGINTFKSREEAVCLDLLPRFRKLLFDS